jgi:hypothetical protein
MKNDEKQKFILKVKVGDWIKWIWKVDGVVDRTRLGEIHEIRYNCHPFEKTDIQMIMHDACIVYLNQIEEIRKRKV